MRESERRGSPSRPFPVEGTDSLDAGVAQIERRLFLVEATPTSEGSWGLLKPFQAEAMLQFAVGDLQAEVDLFVLENPAKIQIVPVSGPQEGCCE